MRFRKLSILSMSAGALLLLTAWIWLASAQPALAQCGSSASSCKNCHEVQGEMPVNQDGTSWHESHAFGDFCSICHAGNSQATDADEAHTGMESPLSNIQASCQQCHPSDLEARAEVYASALGVEIGGDNSETAAEPTSEAPTPTPDSGTGSTMMTTQLSIDDPNLVNYVERYSEIVLGERPVNWGNVILSVMSVMLLVGGGSFVIINEKLVKVSFGDTKAVDTTYPSDVVDMLPAISALKPPARKTLKSILNNPAKTAKVLGLINEITSDRENEA